MKGDKTKEKDGILKEIRRNTTREKEVNQALEKKDGLTWEEDRVVYMEGVVATTRHKVQ